MSSRIIVKGLPKGADEAAVRKHFAEAVGGSSLVTDVRLLRKNGKSRHLAFVGLRSAEAAEQAIKRLNKTFMGAARLRVEVAKEIGSKKLPRPWSRHTKGSSAFKREREDRETKATRRAERRAEKEAKKKAEREQSGKGEAVDPMLAEYLAVKGGRGQRATWASGSGLRDEGATTGAAEAAEAAKMAAGSDSDDEYDEFVPGAAAAAAGAGKADKGEEAEADPWGDNDESDSSDDEDVDSDADLSDSDEEGSAGGVGARKAVGEDGDDDQEEEEEDGSSVSSSSDSEPDVGETGRLFVRNLPYSATDEEVKAHFEAFGKVVECLVPTDATGRRKGIAFITYLIPEQAVAGLEGTDRRFFLGRILHVLPARPRRDAEEGTGPAGGAEGRQSSYKDELEQQRRKDAVTGEEEKKGVWNTLFVRQDAAIKAMAERLGRRGGELLADDDDDSEDEDEDAKARRARKRASAAVRAAMAEAAVIQETKDFLAKEGVDLGTLEGSLQASDGGAARASGGKPTANKQSARSDRVLLVKNLPYEATTAPALRELFGRHGRLVRVVLPPSRVVALIEFEEPARAKVAFRRLAYTRFQRVPLYLEWAPVAVFTEPAAGASDEASAPAPAAAAPAEEPAASGPVGAEAETAGDGGPEGEQADQADPVEGATLYVKNLSFDTTDEGLKEAFAQVVAVRSARIPKRIDPRRPDETLSMGYGFVEMESAKEAEKALKRLQGAVLDGHALQLKRSRNQAGPATSDTGKPSRKRPSAGSAPSTTATKLMVRNVAFEATQKDVRQLFGAYGKVRMVRLPRKFDGGNRGFAFVDFVTHGEAIAALKALEGTHLYGRHLVVEWAKDQGDDTKEGAEAAAEAKTEFGATASAQPDPVEEKQDGKRGKKRRGRPKPAEGEAPSTAGGIQLFSSGAGKRKQRRKDAAAALLSAKTRKAGKE